MDQALLPSCWLNEPSKRRSLELNLKRTLPYRRRAIWQDHLFQNRMEAILESAQEFASHSDNKRKFDLVVCNPPYFNGKPKSPDQARNLARHDESLPLKELLVAAHEIMRPNGTLALAWPMDRKEKLMQESLGEWD